MANIPDKHIRVRSYPDGRITLETPGKSERAVRLCADSEIALGTSKHLEWVEIPEARNGHRLGFSGLLLWLTPNEAEGTIVIDIPWGEVVRAQAGA